MAPKKSASEQSPRRSSRARTSTPAPVIKAAASKPAKKKAKKANGAAAATVDDQDNDDDDQPSPKRKKRAVTPAPKKLAKIISGINALPAPFEPFSSSTFSFDIPALAPADEQPRRVFVFGNGDMGQHGLGVEDNVLCEIKRPRLHVGFEQIIAETKEWGNGVEALEAGGMHTLAADGQGGTWSWGINDNAALGRNTAIPGVESETLETKPMRVENMDEDFKTVRVAAGDSVSFAISDRGEVRCWGSFRSSEGLLGFDASEGSSMTQLKPVSLPSLASHTIVQIACGDDHFLALTSQGYVYAGGNGEQNQLGRKIIQRHKTHGLTPERLALKNIVLVGTGSFHSFAVDKHGTVFAWGLNSFQQTAVSDEDGGWEDTISTPTVVKSLLPSGHGGARVVQIVGGAHHSVFLFSNGEVFACGRNDGYECGLGDDHPMVAEAEERKKEALKRREEMEASEKARLMETTTEGAGMSSDEAALKAAEAAALGIPLPNPYIPIPTKLTFPDSAKIVQIAANSRQNYAVSSTGFVYAWGFGNTSQLGLGNEDEAETPTRITNTALEGFRVLHVTAGGQHTALLAVAGEGSKPSLFTKKPPAENGGGAEKEKKEVNGDAGLPETNGNAEASGSGAEASS